MAIDHILLQYNRLERHYRQSLEHKDNISFLDLSHCLRIWVDMKREVDSLVETEGVQLKLTNTTMSKSAKNALKGNKYSYLPLGSGVESPEIKVKDVMFIKGTLSLDKMKELAKKSYEAGPSTARPVLLRYSEWLASGVYEVPSQDDVHPQIRISREIIIKRVANILGASHPIGSEDDDERENRFDPYILELHNIKLAGGYPATYYQLLEIAKNILDAMKILFDRNA
ncbi:MAG: hypothetical protein IPP66_05180 [Anaerolineales bacterium]|nr:hypothetical protein [Anaerolineales bacterium]